MPPEKCPAPSLSSSVSAVLLLLLHQVLVNRFQASTLLMKVRLRCLNVKSRLDQPPNHPLASRGLSVWDPGVQLLFRTGEKLLLLRLQTVLCTSLPASWQQPQNHLELQNHLGWKRPLRSQSSTFRTSSPAFNVLYLHIFFNGISKAVRR